MRYTLSQLLQNSIDLCVDDTTSSTNNLSTTPVFLQRELNNTVKDIFTLMKKYSLRPLPVTANTVSGQIYYHYPPGFSKIESITIPLGNMILPLKVVQSQEQWDQLHIVPIISNYPEYVFPRRDDFGIFPTPQTAVTMTLTGNYQPKNMVATDYNTGTASTTNGSSTVSISGATLTASMVGRSFYLTANGIDSGSWYRIAAVTPSTSITLENFFAESSVSGSTYVIGESPDIPEELHEFLPYRAAASYYAAKRRDMEHAQQLLNFYYTGDFANVNRKGNIRGGILAVLKDLQERGRGNSQIVEMANSGRPPILAGGVWSTVVTGAA